MKKGDGKGGTFVKHLFKKNQIIITTLAVMIAIAGYLNYSGKLFGDDPNSSAEANTEMVNQELLDISEEDLETESTEIASTDSEVEGTPGEAVLTNGGADSTVAQAKVSREQVRAQNKETLQALIDNTNISEEEKQSAVERDGADDADRRAGIGDRDIDGVQRIFRVCGQSDRRFRGHCCECGRINGCQPGADRGHRDTENGDCTGKYRDHTDPRIKQKIAGSERLW